MCRLTRTPSGALGVFVVVDTICMGMGMGVPIFNILLGIPVGWYVAELASNQNVNFLCPPESHDPH